MGDSKAVKRFASAYWSAYALVVIATLLYFAPLMRAYPQLVIPSPYPDALEFIWTSWRLQGVIEGSRELYETHEVFAPDGASLLLHTVCEGLLLPITFLFKKSDPVWRFNSAVVVTFLLNGFAAVSLCRALGATVLVAALGALLVVFAPNQIGHLTAGHLNFLVLFPLLELFRLLIILNQRGKETQVSPLDLARGILAVALMGRTNLYFLYYTGLLSAVFSLWWIAQRGVFVAKLVRLWSVLCAGIAVNAFHLYRIAALALSKRYTPDHDPATTSADLIAYLVPSSLQRLGLMPELRQIRSGVLFHEGETSVYIGLMLLAALVAVCSIRSMRRAADVWLLLALAALAMVASFGPWVRVGGERVVWNPLDYLLRTLLPLYPSVPARFGLFVGLFLVSAVVVGVSSSGSRAGRNLVVGALVLAVVELLPLRCNVTQLSPASPVLARLREDSSVKVVVDQSIIAQHAMLRQTIHEKPIIGGFLSRRPRKQERELRGNRLLQRIGASSREHPVETLRAGWCALGADALLLEASRTTLFKDTLHDLGLTLRDEDGVWALFKPEEGACGGGGQVSSRD